MIDKDFLIKNVTELTRKMRDYSHPLRSKGLGNVSKVSLKILDTIKSHMLTDRNV